MVHDFVNRIPPTHTKRFRMKAVIISFVLILGLAMGAIFLLKTDWLAKPAEKNGVPPVSKPVKTAAKIQTPPEPQFEFYTLLPKRQVNVAKTPNATVAMPASNAEVAANTEPAVSSSSQTQYALQIASFTQLEAAHTLTTRLSEWNIKTHVETSSQNGTTWYRIVTDTYSSQNDLQAAQADLRKHGIDSLVIHVPH
ncbi:MAG TPA: SPOR domain-containing protein [Coxiellaceae bacterium]|nr:SPOR domain-containing protein [Coxiellaceae bacterium]